MYSAKIDGQPTSFGTSGFLYRSNKLMYDRKTNSLWSSLVGEPVIGELAERDEIIKLDFFPVALTTWGEWVAENPDTKVLSLDTDYYSPRFYEPEKDARSIYYDYRVSAETMFPVWNRDTALEAKDEVLGLSVGDVYRAYPIMKLRELRVVNDSIGDKNVVIVSSGVSSDVRVFESGDETFRLEDGADVGRAPTSLVDSDGDTWIVSETGLRRSGEETESLMRLPSFVVFWFGWYAFHPDTSLYSAD